jgi:hypothetical protein
MIGHAWTIFIAPARRLGAVLPDVCPKSLPIDRSTIFHFYRHSILPLSTFQTALSAVVRTLRHSPNCHSKRRSFSDTASFK